MKTIALTIALLAASPVVATAGPVIPEQFRGDWCAFDESIEGVFIYKRGRCKATDQIKILPNRFVSHEEEASCRVVKMKATNVTLKCEEVSIEYKLRIEGSFFIMERVEK